MAHDVAFVGVGALCIGVLRGITLCQVERFRRLRLLASHRGEEEPAGETPAGQAQRGRVQDTHDTPGKRQHARRVNIVSKDLLHKVMDPFRRHLRARRAAGSR
jgi:hypothetical protein